MTAASFGTAVLARGIWSTIQCQQICCAGDTHRDLLHLGGGKVPELLASGSALIMRYADCEGTRSQGFDGTPCKTSCASAVACALCAGQLVWGTASAVLSA